MEQLLPESNESTDAGANTDVPSDAVEISVDHVSYVAERSDARLVYYITGYMARKRILSITCDLCKAAFPEPDSIILTLTKIFLNQTLSDSNLQSITQPKLTKTRGSFQVEVSQLTSEFSRLPTCASNFKAAYFKHQGPSGHSVRPLSKESKQSAYIVCVWSNVLFL